LDSAIVQAYVGAGYRPCVPLQVFASEALAQRSWTARIIKPIHQVGAYWQERSYSHPSLVPVARATGAIIMASLGYQFLGSRRLVYMVGAGILAATLGLPSDKSPAEILEEW